MQVYVVGYKEIQVFLLFRNGNVMYCMQHDYAAAKATGRYVHGYKRKKENVKKWEGKIRGDVLTETKKNRGKIRNRTGNPF